MAESGTLMKLAGADRLASGAAATVNHGKESVQAASKLSNARMSLQSISFIDRHLGFTQEDNPQRTGTAMAENCTAGFCFQDLTEAAVGVKDVPRDRGQFIAGAGIDNQNRTGIQIIPVLDTFPDIIPDDLLNRAAVFLHHGHFTVNDFDTGMQFQQISAQGSDSRAAAAFFHVIQPVEDKAGFNAGNHTLQKGENFPYRLPGLSSLRRDRKSVV